MLASRLRTIAEKRNHNQVWMDEQVEIAVQLSQLDKQLLDSVENLVHRSGCLLRHRTRQDADQRGGHLDAYRPDDNALNPLLGGKR